MNKRRLLVVAGATCLAMPSLAGSRLAMASMAEGPFYPSARWRERWPDQDADLTRVSGIAATARGEHLGLEAVVTDSGGRLIDSAVVEIWQCDTRSVYRHQNVQVQPGDYDTAFQGFGGTKSDKDGRVRFRTIRPTSYPGRTPHIHLKLRHASFGEFTTQLFVAGEPANASDGLYRRLQPNAREALEMKLQVAPTDSGLRWLVRQQLVLPI